VRLFHRGIAFVSALCFAAQPATKRTIVERLQDPHLEALHQARVQWMRDRVVYPPLGIYHDYRAVILRGAPPDREAMMNAAKKYGVKAILYAAGSGTDAPSGFIDGVLAIPGAARDAELCFPAPNCEFRLAATDPGRAALPADVNGMVIYTLESDERHRELSNELAKGRNARRLQKRLTSKMKEYPEEVMGAATAEPFGLAGWDAATAKRSVTGTAVSSVDAAAPLPRAGADAYAPALGLTTTHVLALDLNQDQIIRSLRAGHAYVAHDWLCDPTGFSFVALNNLGVFEMGDPVPLIPNTRLAGRFPAPATARLIHNGQVVAERDGQVFEFAPPAPGAYRLEAWLNVDGEMRPWIFSNPIYLHPPATGEFNLPPASLAPGVEAFGDIPYVSESDESDEHKLDLYIPAGKKSFPVLMFLHGGSGPMGDRRVYTYIGNRFANAGFGVVIPSYRTAPASDPPAQVEDAAAAFAWVHNYISKYGGDPQRIVVAGHSAGGGMAALLALNGVYLGAHGLKPADIHGVIGISGIYRARQASSNGGAKIDSALDHVNGAAPPFLLAYCQWDHLGLPQQARDLDAALRRNFVSSKLLLVNGENHISEIIHLSREDDPLAQAIIGFVRSAAPQ
jgi:acetyl esterase/lipase